MNHPAQDDLIDLLRHDVGAAREEAERLLARAPADPLARLVCAEATRRGGDARTALMHAREGRRAAPDFAPLGLEEARCRAELDDLHGAVRVLDSTLAHSPDFVPGWRALAQLREQLGDLDGARAAAERQRTIGLSDPALAKASELLHRGRLGEAEFVLRQHVKAHPLDVSGIRLLADVGNRLGVLEDARRLLERCLELAPDFHMARHDYANTLIKLQQFDQAEAELDALKRAEPESTAHRVLEGFLLVRMGRYEAAVDVYEALVARQPHLARVQMSLGHALKTIGRQADSIAAYRAALDAEPSLGEAWWSLANLKTFVFSGDDIAQMREQLRSRAINRSDRYHLQFALGKALEDCGETDEAFGAYAAGNELRRDGLRYDAARITAEREAQEAFFSQSFLADREGWGDPAPDPIFIVGLPRSGSTLLEQILASHSAVEGTFELPDIISMVRRLSGRKRPDAPSDYPGILSRLSKDDVRALGTEYLDRTHVHRTGKPRFIDKMPNNFQHVGFIKLILPNATIIDARRHPMACGFSNFKQLFARGQNFSYNLPEIARYYLDYVAWMRLWDRILPGAIHRVIYEDMVAEAEQQVRALLAHCGLAFEPACLAFHETRRAVRTASSEQVRQPIYQSSVEQWRAFERHLAPLRDNLAPLFRTDEHWKS